MFFGENGWFYDSKDEDFAPSPVNPVLKMIIGCLFIAFVMFCAFCTK